MARSTPRMDDALLIGGADAAHTIAVGSPAWYAWLEDATTCAFTSAVGSFTARKERRGSAGGYWKAYRKRAGILYRAYLGKSADLTHERLTLIAAQLAGRAPEPLVREETSGVAPALDSTSAPSALLTTRLPTGTLTFLFADIEGSTQRWEEHPQAMPAALTRHDAILPRAVADHSGVVFKTVGDGVHAVFARAADALAAALRERALYAEDWGAVAGVSVRMALHTGAAELRDGDYFGATLNRLARILVLGHGGQILISRTTHDFVADELPAQTNLDDLGTHHLARKAQRMLHITFSEQDIADLRYERYHHPHPRVQMKMEALLLKSRNLPHHEIAAYVGVSEPTLRTYFRTYLTGGIAALREVHFYRPESDLEQHRTTLEAHFTAHPPANATQSAAAIEELTGIKRSPTQIRIFLKRLGLKRLKTYAIPAKYDQERQETFKEKTLSHG